MFFNESQFETVHQLRSNPLGGKYRPAFMVREMPPDICPELSVLHALKCWEFNFAKDKGS